MVILKIHLFQFLRSNRHQASERINNLHHFMLLIMTNPPLTFTFRTSRRLLSTHGFRSPSIIAMVDTTIAMMYGSGHRSFRHDSPTYQILQPTSPDPNLAPRFPQATPNVISLAPTSDTSSIFRLTQGNSSMPEARCITEQQFPLSKGNWEIHGG